MFVVGKVGDIPPGGRKIIEVEGRSIGVFNIGGEYFALRNTCPHAGGPLCKGTLGGLLLADEPGKYRYLRRGELLRCPWHGWEFDVRTGQSWIDPRKQRVRSYEVREEAGSRILESEVALSADGLQKGPYKAETYPVVSDGQYIVIEM